jgi:hypothetical protein
VGDLRFTIYEPPVPIPDLEVKTAGQHGQICARAEIIHLSRLDPTAIML